jgi:hypothetical protein
MDTTRSTLGAAVLFIALAGAVPAAAAGNKPTTETDAKKKVLQQKTEDQYVSAYFGVNRNLGRAWVEVAVQPYVDTPQRDVIARKMIKGLYYDAERKAVIYQREGKETVCAEDWHFLLSTSLKTTGNCELKVSAKPRKVDDGFTVETEPVTKVTLVAHNLTPAKTAKAAMGDVDVIVIAPDESN